MNPGGQIPQLMFLTIEPNNQSFPVFDPEFTEVGKNTCLGEDHKSAQGIHYPKQRPRYAIPQHHIPSVRLGEASMVALCGLRCAPVPCGFAQPAVP